MISRSVSGIDLDINTMKNTGKTVWGIILIVLSAWVLLVHLPGTVIDEWKDYGRGYLLTGTANDGNSFLFACYEGIDETRMDYHFGEILSNYLNITNLGPPINSQNPVMCNKYEASSTYDPREVDNKTVFIGGTFTYGLGVQEHNSFPYVYSQLTNEDIFVLADDAESIASSANKLFTISQARVEKAFYAWTPMAVPQAPVLRQVFKSNDLVTINNPFTATGNRLLAAIELFKKHRAMNEAEAEGISWYEYIHGPGNADGVSQEKDLLIKMSETAKSSGFEFVVVLLPLLVEQGNEYPLSEIHDQISDFLEANGIEHIDLSDSIFSRPLKEMTLHPFDRKPGAEAHKLIATSLAKFTGAGSAETKGSYHQGNRFRKRASMTADRYDETPASTVSLVVFCMMMVLIATFLFAMCLQLRDMFTALKNHISSIVLLMPVLGAGLVARLLIAPRAHLVMPNEHYLMRLADMWLSGRYDANTLSIFPGTIIPFFASFLCFGLDSITGGWTAITLSLISIILCYAITLLLTKSKRIAVIAAFLMALFPLCIRFSFTLASGPTNMFFELLCVLTLLLWAQSRKTAHAVMFAASAGYLLFVRIHNLPFVVLLVGIWIFLQLKEGRDPTTSREISAKRFASSAWLSPSLILLFSFLVYFVFTFNALGFIGSNMYTDDTSGMTTNIVLNLWTNLLFFFSTHFESFLFSILAIPGLIAIIFNRANKKQFSGLALLLPAWLVIYFGIHLLRVYGAYLNNPAETRHIPELAPPLLIMSAIGIYRLYYRLSSSTLKITYLIMLTTILILIPFVYRNDIREHSPASLLVEQAIAEAALYPVDEIFITNSHLFIDSFDYDLSTIPILANGRDSFEESCPDIDNCTLVLYQYNIRDSYFRPEYLQDCEKSLVKHDANVLFCSMDMIEMVPDIFLERPDYEGTSGVAHPLFHE